MLSNVTNVLQIIKNGIDRFERLSCIRCCPRVRISQYYSNARTGPNNLQKKIRIQVLEDVCDGHLHAKGMYVNKTEIR